MMSTTAWIDVDPQDATYDGDNGEPEVVAGVTGLDITLSS